MEEVAKYIRNGKPTTFSHGLKGIESCAYCDEPLTDDNTGKVITFWEGDNTFKEIVCDTCLSTLEDYPWPAAFTIKEFPNKLNAI